MNVVNILDFSQKFKNDHFIWWCFSAIMTLSSVHKKPCICRNMQLIKSVYLIFLFKIVSQTVRNAKIYSPCFWVRSVFIITVFIVADFSCKQHTRTITKNFTASWRPSQHNGILKQFAHDSIHLAIVKWMLSDLW